jgi:competence protein ComEC
MILFSLLFAAGVWVLQQQSALPGPAQAGMALPVLLTALLLRRSPVQRILRIILLSALAFVLGFFYAAFLARLRLADTLPPDWQGRDIQVIGVIAELPRQNEHGLSFAFDVERSLTPDAHVPRHILLSTYDDGRSLPLHAGERWKFTVRLKQPHGTENPNGFDFEAWMLEYKLRAAGYVRSAETNVLLESLAGAPGYVIESIREKVRDRIRHALGDAPYAGVLAALAIGDQNSIPAAQWQVFTRTGVNHLMSISGLHITMLAGLAFALVYAAWIRSTRLTLALPARKAAAMAGLLAAVGYALLSGFSVPAQRTVYMLAAIAAALMLSRNIAPSQILAIALAVVLLADPWSVTAPGFWLSFGAVSLIFYVTANRVGRDHWIIEYGRVQWAMTIGLIPPLLAMFQQVSLVSPVANAFAIPLVSFIVVPLALLGAVIPVDGILWLAHQAMGLCMAMLEWLNQLPDAVWKQHQPPAWSIAAGMLGALWCLSPSGFPSRWLGLLLMLPMFLALPAAPPAGVLRLTVFDVGQGLSVFIQTHSHALLYDAGPAFSGEMDSGNRIIIPALRARGITHLDGMILTHNDMDHIGGARSVIQSIPVEWLSSSFDPMPLLHIASSSMATGGGAQSAQVTNLSLTSMEMRRCMDGQHWDWDGIQFEILHPSAQSYLQHGISDNDRGCVLRISNGGNRILLSADIESDSERRLLQLHRDILQAALLVVPHHGSTTSSSTEFVHAVHPRYAIFTVGYRNRFGHPRAEVVQRYRAIGSRSFRSDEDGALSIDIDRDNFGIAPYRKEHRRYWYLQ